MGIEANYIPTTGGGEWTDDGTILTPTDAARQVQIQQQGIAGQPDLIIGEDAGGDHYGFRFDGISSMYWVINGIDRGRWDSSGGLSMAGQPISALGAVIANNGSGFELRNETKSATNPVYCFNDDLDSGLGGITNEPSIIANSVEGLTLVGASGGAIPRWSSTEGITAFAGGGQASATLLISHVNEVTVVGTIGDSVRLPSAQAGMEVVIFNNAANACDVFPATGDDLGAGVNTAVSLAGGATVRYTAFNATDWRAT